MGISFGTGVEGLTADGLQLHAPVFNEHQVRAAAGITLVMGAGAFCLAFFEQQYIPLQVVTTLFFVEFVTRIRVGLRYSPVGVIAGWMTRGTAPEWVSAKPKLFAWHLGLGMSFAMMVITNSGIRGALPATICAICMTLMWMEAALGICCGCKVYAALVRRGWIDRDPEIERCAGGVCDIAEPAR